MFLNNYNKKRNFTLTPEPVVQEKQNNDKDNYNKSGRSSTVKLAFVVHKHYASHLHYDLRLELDGVLKSWAVPKGPSINPPEKRLAVMVEDHPLDYKNFQGIIPEGNYGAGKVYIWDYGFYHALETQDRDKSTQIIKDGLEKGHITFILEGEKLKGEFALIRIKKGDPKNWLLIKKRDEFAGE
jgi:bifunctional non-homologous end joining protein LigD